MKKFLSFFACLTVFWAANIFLFENYEAKAYVSAANPQESTTAPDSYVVNIPDTVLKKFLNKSLSRVYWTVRADDATITAWDMKRLTNVYWPLWLNWNNTEKVQNAEWLQFLTEATVIHIKNNNISDLSPFQDLSKLVTFEADRNNISSLSTFHADKLPKLVTLDLSYNQIVDIDPIKKATKVTKLNLYRNKVVDAKPLEALTQLKYLDLWVNPLNLSTVSGVTWLDELHLLWIQSAKRSNDPLDLTPLLAFRWKPLRLLNLNTNNLNWVNISTIKDLWITTLMVAWNKMNNLKDMISNWFANIDTTSTFSSQEYATSGIQTTNILENPVVWEDWKVVPITETQNFKNANADWTLNPNGEYIKFIDLYWDWIADIDWSKNFSHGNIVNRPFSWKLKVKYSFPSKTVNPSSSMNPDEEKVYFSFPYLPASDLVDKYSYRIEECDENWANCSEILAATEVSQPTNITPPNDKKTVEFQIIKKENKKYKFSVKTIWTNGKISEEKSIIQDVKVIKIEFEAGSNWSLTWTKEYTVFAWSTFASKTPAPTPTPSVWYKFDSWSEVFPTTVIASKKYTASFVIDETKWITVKFESNNINWSISTVAPQKVLKTKKYSELQKPTITPNSGYKAIWSPAEPNQNDTFSSEAWTAKTYTISFVVDQTQKVFNYKVKYFLNGTTNPVPGIARNEEIWNAYIWETISSINPPIVTWYKLVAGQTTTFTVNSNNFEKNIYYEIDNWQKYSYKVDYYKKNVKFETETWNVLKADPKVNSVTDKRPNGYKLDTANSTTLPHTVTADNETINIKYIVDTSARIFAYEIQYLEDGTTTEILPRVTWNWYIWEEINVAHTGKTWYAINPSQPTKLVVEESTTPTIVKIFYKKDMDNDWIPDDVDSDIDWDWVSNAEEARHWSDPRNPNSKPQKYTNIPQKRDLEVRAGNTLSDANIKDSITNKNTFPNWTNITYDNNALRDLLRTAWNKELELTITYPDWSVNTVRLKIKVLLNTSWSSPSGSLIVRDDSRVTTWSDSSRNDRTETWWERRSENNSNNTWVTWADTQSNLTPNQNWELTSNQKLLEELKNKLKEENKELKIREINGEPKVYSVLKRYDNCGMIWNILWDYNSDYKLTFKDVTEKNYLDELQRLEKVWIIKWTKPWIFEPNRWITRSEFLAIVLQVHCYDVSHKPESLPFYDVDLDSWQARVIKVWTELWIIKWYEKDKKWTPFRPDREISKIEAFWIMMKMREIEILENYKDKYTDKKANWQDKPLSAGEYLWILKPEETNYKFHPDSYLNRDEMVKMIIDIIRLY